MRWTLNPEAKETEKIRYNLARMPENRFEAIATYFRQFPNNQAEQRRLAEQTGEHFPQLLAVGHQLLSDFCSLIQEQQPLFALPNATDLDVLQPVSPEEQRDDGPMVPYYPLANPPWLAIHQFLAQGGTLILPRLLVLAEVVQAWLVDHPGVDIVFPQRSQLDQIYTAWWEKFAPFKIKACPVDLGAPRMHAKIEIFFNDPQATQMFYLTWHLGGLINGEYPEETSPPLPEHPDWEQIAQFVDEIGLPK